MPLMKASFAPLSGQDLRKLLPKGRKRWEEGGGQIFSHPGTMFGIKTTSWHSHQNQIWIEKM